MPCSATSQLTNAPTAPLPLTMPTTNSQWSIFVQRLVDYLALTRDAANRTGVNVIPAAYALYDAPALPALSISGANGALDATKTLFGNASLKLTATAATVTVQFTGSPITLAPYLRWIESVYIQSSRTSITGTLAVVTGAQSYPVDISGTLTPAMWGRLYGDCDLTADDSSSATILLTLTGCTVGDTFNLEGWQLEAASGATNLPSAFVNSAAAGSLDSVPDGSGYARVNSAHVSGGVAYNYKGVWSSATAYVKGDETVYSGSYWLALAGNTNSAPAQGNANWQVVGAYNNYQGAWSSTVTYYAGQETTYNGNYWVATATNTNSAPSTSNANWIIAGPQNLDKIADGSSRFAVVNGASLEGVARTDSNDLAIIDFSQAAHVNKNLGNIPDNATSSRYAVSAVDPNKKALIDFTQSGHSGKTLANMPDDSGSSRYAVASIDGNRRALVDLSQSGHVNKTQDYIPSGNSYSQYMQGFHSETVDNATFLLPIDPQGNVPGWSQFQGTPGAVGYTPSGHFNNASVLWITGAATGAQTVRKYPCKQGDFVSAWADLYAPDAATDGLLQVRFYNVSGTLLTNPQVFTSALATWQTLNAAGAAPANAAYFTLLAYQASASTHHLGVMNVRISVNDVRVSGSGVRLGNLRNNIQRAVTNIPAQVPAAPTYSAAAGSPATATITVAAFTVLAGSAPSTAYNSSSVSVTGTGGTTVTYYLYFNDPNNTGGTQTLNATTNGATIYAGDGYVYVGSIAVTFPTSGSGSGGGSGGGGACVMVGSFGPTGRFEADTAEVMTPDGPAKVRRAIVSPQKCVRVECENGAALECSEDAPLMTPRGRVHAVYSLGRKIQTSAGRSRVSTVAKIGIREIVAIDAGDVAFYAGESQDGPFILHHNKIIP